MKHGAELAAKAVAQVTKNAANPSFKQFGTEAAKHIREGKHDLAAGVLKTGVQTIGKQVVKDSITSHTSQITKGLIGGAALGIGISTAKSVGHLDEFNKAKNNYREMVPNLAKEQDKREKRELDAFMDSCESKYGFEKYMAEIRKPNTTTNDKMTKDDLDANSIRVLSAIKLLDAQSHLEKEASTVMERGIVKTAEALSEHFSKTAKTSENKDLDKAGAEKLPPVGTAIAGVIGEAGGVEVVSIGVTAYAMAKGGLFGGIPFIAAKQLAGRVTEVVLDNAIGSYTATSEKALLAQAKEDINIPRERLSQTAIDVLENRAKLKLETDKKIQEAVEADLKEKQAAREKSRESTIELPTQSPTTLSNEEKLAKMVEEQIKSDKAYEDKEAKRRIDAGKMANTIKVGLETIADSPGKMASEARRKVLDQLLPTPEVSKVNPSSIADLNGIMSSLKSSQVSVKETGNITPLVGKDPTQSRTQ